jgi:hypothetical protein
MLNSNMLCSLSEKLFCILSVLLVIHWQEFHAIGFLWRSLWKTFEIQPSDKGNNSSASQPPISQWGVHEQGWLILCFL